MLNHAVAAASTSAEQTSRKILLVVGDPDDGSSRAAMLEGVAFEVVAATHFVGAADPPDLDRFDMVVVAPAGIDRSGTAPVEPARADVPVSRVLVVDAADALQEAEQGYRRLVTMSGEAIVVHAAGCVVLANDAAAELLGADSPAELVGRPIDAFIDETDREQVRSLQAAKAGGIDPLVRLRMIRIDGTVVDVDGSAAACRYDGRLAVQMTLHDVAGRRLLAPADGHPSQCDPLTELPNRSQFRDRLVGAMARARRDSRLVGVILIDLDRFNAINRRFGLDAGDAALREIAQRLKNSLRRGDTVARVGGDEFSAIVEGLADREGAAIFAARALASLSLPMTIDGSEIRLTASLGIALSSGGSEGLDGLLRAADVAMHHAKEQGRNNVQFHSPELDARTRRDELRHAEIARRAGSLTPREREVMELLVAGKPNKMVAYLLGTHTRTIENHRARIMDKMQADSLPELVRMALSNG